MSKSLRIPVVIFLIVFTISIFEFQTSLSSPILRLSPKLNLISHFESKTEIEFPEETGNRCKLSGCNSTSSIIRYVCGSDDNSYKNIAELECFRKSCHPDLKLKSQGKCPVKMSKTVESGTSLREKKLYLPTSASESEILCNPDKCGCPDEFTPVCGTDGITYGNRCLLGCNRKCNPEVKEHHDGYCGRIFFKDSSNKIFQASAKRQQPIVYTSLLL